MKYDATPYFLDDSKNCIKCNILAKPKHSEVNWPAGVSRAIVSCRMSVDRYPQDIKKVIDFAKKYITKKNLVWDNNAEFSGIMFLFPNGAIKRYDVK